MIILVLLAVVQLSSGAIPLMMRNIMDPQMIDFDEAEGLLYDLPEEEDPLLVQHQLSSIGAMPIFTLLESAKKRRNSKMDGISEKVKIAESRRIIDEVMIRLEYARAKLEKGNGNIYTDVEKVIQSLKTLNKSVRPDIREVLDSLQSIMTLGSPIMMPKIKEPATTSEPESYEKTEAFEKTPNVDREALSVRFISNYKPEFEEKPAEIVPFNSSQSMSAEKSSEEEKIAEEKIAEEKIAEEKIAEEKIAEEKPKSSESSEISKESYKASKFPFETKIKEKKNNSFDGDDVMSSYKAKITWKSAGMV